VHGCGAEMAAVKNCGHFERLAETGFGQPTVEKAMDGFFNGLIAWADSGRDFPLATGEPSSGRRTGGMVGGGKPLRFDIEASSSDVEDSGYREV